VEEVFEQLAGPLRLRPPREKKADRRALGIKGGNWYAAGRTSAQSIYTCLHRAAEDDL
jgi:hypothetical protein